MYYLQLVVPHSSLGLLNLCEAFLLVSALLLPSLLLLLFDGILVSLLLLSLLGGLESQAGGDHTPRYGIRLLWPSLGVERL